MPMCSTAAEMFEEQPWNLEAYSESCFKTWGVRPNSNLVLEQYGGARVSSYSNVVFSNGLLDPWSAGGVISNENVVGGRRIGGSSGIPYTVVLIPGVPHHIDIRASHPDDPIAVKDARVIHKSEISKWLNAYYSNE